MSKINVSLTNGMKPKNMSGSKVEAVSMERSAPAVVKKEGKDLRTGRTKGGK